MTELNFRLQQQEFAGRMIEALSGKEDEYANYNEHAKVFTLVLAGEGAAALNDLLQKIGEYAAARKSTSGGNPEEAKQVVLAAFDKYLRKQSA
jgi:hypothetical protein